MRKQVAVTESLCINRVMNKGAEKYCFMEKVFDMHIHYSFDMPLKTTIEIFKEELTCNSILFSQELLIFQSQ